MNPVLTVLRLTPATARGIADTRETHRIVAWSVGDVPDGAPRTLWARPARNALVVQGWREPALVGLPGFESAGSVEVAPPPAGPRVLTVIANTVRRSGQRATALTGEEEVRAWAMARLAGATIDALSAQPLPSAHVTKHGRRFPIARTALRITCTVTDPARLWPLIRDGIGRERAYGCGLLISAPVAS